MKLPTCFAAGLGVALLTSGAAMAGPIQAGWSLDMSNDYDQPAMTLTNTSDAGVQLTGLEMTIGDTSFGYDFVDLTSDPAGGSASLAGSTEGPPGDGSTTDLLQLSFAGFDAGESAEFNADIDSDAGDSTEDYRDIFFDNGGAANAEVVATFNSELFADNPTRTVSLLLPDNDDETPVTFGFQAEESYASAVPVPAALPLMGAGLAGFGLFARRRKA